MNTYYIRYNTQHGESNLVWRIIENKKETLVKDFSIHTVVTGGSTIENGIQKWNVVCKGNMQVINDIAYIK